MPTRACDPASDTPSMSNTNQERIDLLGSGQGIQAPFILSAFSAIAITTAAVAAYFTCHVVAKISVAVSATFALSACLAKCSICSLSNHNLYLCKQRDELIREVEELRKKSLPQTDASINRTVQAREEALQQQHNLEIACLQAQLDQMRFDKETSELKLQKNKSEIEQKDKTLKETKAKLQVVTDSITKIEQHRNQLEEELKVLRQRWDKKEAAQKAQ